MAVVITAPMLIDAALESGFNHKHGYITAGAIFGFLSFFFFILVFLFIRERDHSVTTERLSFRNTLILAWNNIPFRYVAIIYLLNWTMLDMVAVVFPFYLLYWVAKGNLLAKVSILGINLALESAFFGILMTVCIISVPFWLWFTRRRNKRDAYVTGSIFLITILLSFLLVRPGQSNLILLLGGTAGFGVACAYVLPDALFPDIIEWDELRAGKRQEGI